MPGRSCKLPVYFLSLLVLAAPAVPAKEVWFRLCRRPHADRVQVSLIDDSTARVDGQLECNLRYEHTEKVTSFANPCYVEVWYR